MAIGRISGPLLAQNLFRDNVPLAFYNTSSSEAPVLYLDVAAGRVGVQTDAPLYELDVVGTVQSNELRTTTATIGNTFISSGTISTTVGPLTLNPGGSESTVIDSDLDIKGQTVLDANIPSTDPVSGTLVVTGGLGVTGDSNINGVVKITGDTQATDVTTGQFVVAGGMGVTQDLWVGGTLHAILSTSTVATISENADAVRIVQPTDGIYYPMLSGGTSGYITPQTSQLFSFDLDLETFTARKIVLNQSGVLSLSVSGSALFQDTVTISNRLIVNDATQSTSTTTGAVTVSGGVGIRKNLNVGGDLNVGGNIHAIGNITADGNIQLGNNTGTDTLIVGAEIDSDLIPKVDNKYTVGNSTSTWAEGYFNKLYSNILESQTGSININPADNLLQVNANIRVTGDRPIGTAPVVTNVLYVTVDGSDTNDGRAEDPSRACRTIGGALRSPYYGPGTSIQVAPGHYLEQNPLLLQPYTSVLGTDLRTTIVEAINKTQDLFHVQSGCYLFGMQFLNGRSGVLPGSYANGYNRGAYCVAFPPQVNGSKIDTFHSPYVQNCTNQTGPWLMDGTMFIPNQTVQAPVATGTGTWVANTTTIVVTLTTGTITTGLSINNGQQDPGFFNARTLLLANKPFIQEQVVTYVDQTYPSFEYEKAKCFRDVGIILENVAYDSTFGGNQKSVEAGLAYYNGVVSLIAGQETETIAAINYINTLAQDIIANTTATDLLSGSGLYSQVINTALDGGTIASNSILNNINIITDIIDNGTSSAPEIFKSAGPDAASISAEILMQANRQFIQNDTIAWITNTYPSFTYNQDLCYRDVGLIVDAVSQDILIGGNKKTIETALSYWEGGYNQIVGQETTTTQAISHARDIAIQIIANTSVTAQVGNTSTQVINNYFENGHLVETAVVRNFNIINTVITSGPEYAPTRYQGGGLFASTGIQIEETKYAPRVTNITSLGGNSYRLQLDTPTIGFGINATVYFGTTSVFPLQDSEIPDEWAQRRIDTKGAMGGMLVDGSVVSNRSPVGSMVLNAFTQVAQGGRGVHIINNGYAQLVSIFTIFCNVAVEVDTGGIASITNSNSNFGDICLVAKGSGAREFSGTVYNPPYPTNVPNGEYYPNGYWPQNGRVLVYVPDTANRPHISLIMEVEPPSNYINQQGFPGFLTGASNTSTISTGSITISGIDTTDISIGQTLYIRDQFGRTNDGAVDYLTSGTIITDVGYQTITLSKGINQGGGEVLNPNYFTLYTCGNAYYTVLSSQLTENPVAVGQTLIPAQVPDEVSALSYLSTVLESVIDNVAISPVNTTTSQVILSGVTGGVSSWTFIDDRLAIIADIAQNGTGAAPTITKTGTIPAGAGSAVTLIKANTEFLAAEIVAYVDTIAVGSYDKNKCARDVKLILQQLIYDLEAGGNYYSVYAGLSYWSRAGTYHIVELGENITNSALMPDGATVNFYQRSYISASGYTFEYVGAGMNYGALPQVGKADPVQSKEVVQVDGGKVFFTSTDQNGDFRIGPGLVISQATGVLSGRTFTKSLFANLTPFILAIEAGV